LKEGVERGESVTREGRFEQGDQRAGGLADEDFEVLLRDSPIEARSRKL